MSHGYSLIPFLYWIDRARRGSYKSFYIIGNEIKGFYNLLDESFVCTRYNLRHRPPDLFDYPHANRP